MRRALILVALAGCSNWFGIDRIPYEGPIDGNVPTGDGGASDAIDALGPTSTLTVVFMGTGQVVIDGAVTCTSTGGMCMQVYTTGTHVELVSGGQSAGSLFSYWGDACQSQNNYTDVNPTPVCDLTMSGDKQVLAAFASDVVLNLIPSIGNTTDTSAFIKNSSSDSGAICTSGLICTLDFSLGAPPPFQIQGVNDPPCATFGTFTGQDCQLDNNTCMITFVAGVSVLNVEYDFDLGAGTGCMAFK